MVYLAGLFNSPAGHTKPFSPEIINKHSKVKKKTPNKQKKYHCHLKLERIWISTGLYWDFAKVRE